MTYVWVALALLAVGSLMNIGGSLMKIEQHLKTMHEVAEEGAELYVQEMLKRN